MKRTLSLFAFLSVFFLSNAQWALGLRPSISTSGGFDDRRRAEISLMTPQFAKNSRIEIDFGWGNRDVAVPVLTTLSDGQQTVSYTSQRQYWYGATAMLQWSHKVFWKLYYYAGLGASAYSNFVDDLYILGANMQLGLEVKLKIPLQITVDYRPMLDLLDGLAYYHTFALGLRYKIGGKQIAPEPEPNFITKLRKRFNSKD